jgi:tetratricopeptide (TPR) repeat protein
MTETTPPRVFISYSHDSEAHKGRVLALADRLRAHGIKAIVDSYEQSPPQGWPAWCETEIDMADFVLMVCTETYLRRVRGEEEPGKGHGVLWEARLIRQDVYDAGSASNKYVPVLFADGSPTHVPRPVRGASIYCVETPEGYEALCRLLTNQPVAPPPPVGQWRSLPPRQREGGAPPEPSRLATSLPHPRVEDVFVGRLAERAALAAALIPTSGTGRPVVVSGMAGVGKSYLVDRFFWENVARFPGGYLRLALDPDKPASAANLLSTLRDRLKLPAGDGAALAAQLLTPLTLLHIENVDSFDTGRVVGELAEELRGCALVVSARFRRLGTDVGWRQVPLVPFNERMALEQLHAELGEDAGRQETWPAFVAALGFLPLALHLAAGHLRVDHRADAFLRRLRAKNLALTGADPADPTFRERSRALLSDNFELSLTALRREGGAEGDTWLAAFSTLGHAPAAGFGESIGAAISGLSADAFEDMALAAARLSLLDLPRGDGSAFRLHPLLAELVRLRTDKDAAFARMSEWFIARLPEGGEDQGPRWHEIHEEIAALTEWLPRVPSSDRARVERAGSRYAIGNGPYHAWLRFCAEAVAGDIGEDERSNILWTLGNVALRGGVPDIALAAAEEKRELDRRRGAEREGALASGLIADILQVRGQLDEALRIRNEEQLAVYERLHDVREAAVAKGKIADILQMRGDLGEALRIRQQEVLPIYQQIGDARAAAVTRGKIAELLQSRGDLDEALTIYEEAHRALRDLGEVRDAAVARGKVAEIRAAQGYYDKGLQIFEKEVMPVYKRLGDAHGILTGQTSLAIMHLRREQEGDRDEAHRLLCSALDQAQRLRLPEARLIEQVLKQAGLS